MGFPVRLKQARRRVSNDRVGITEPASRSTIAGWEQGQRIPRLDAVEQAAYALGLSPSFLAFGVESVAVQPDCGLRCDGVAARLRATRTERGLTILALADSAGLSHNAVRSTETGASIPSIATAEAFAIALGVSPGWLAYGLGPVELPNRRAIRSKPAQAQPSEADTSADSPL